MTNEDEERLGRPDGQRYNAPESEDTRSGKEWSYAALGLLFVVIMALIARQGPDLRGLTRLDDRASQSAMP